MPFRWNDRHAELVRTMMADSDATGREVHRRLKLIDLLSLFGFKYCLHDVAQRGRVPDLRYYLHNENTRENSMPSPFIVETKDIGEISCFESINFRQILRYVYLNRTALTAVAVTDYRKWYQFEFDNESPSLGELFELAKASVGKDSEWRDAGGEESARTTMLKFLRTPEFDFNSLTSRPSSKKSREICSLFDSDILSRTPVLAGFEKLENNIDDQASTLSYAESLATVMFPLVDNAIEELRRASPTTKAIKRFKLWMMQTEDREEVERLFSEDLSAEEEKFLQEQRTRFAWLAASSLLNLLYFFRGLEERGLIPRMQLINENDPSVIFQRVWNWISDQTFWFAADFVRVQRIYCDWLIPVVNKTRLRQLIIQVAALPLDQLRRSDLLGSLYERLMQSLDKESRKRLGQYYTPKPIAELLWQLAWSTLKKANVAPEEVMTVDPGAGSGMLLCRGIELLLSEMNPEQKNLGQAIRELATRGISGLEINPLSAAIARINLYFTYADEIIKRSGNARELFVNKISVSDIPVFNADAYKETENPSDELQILANIEGEDYEAWLREAVSLNKTKTRRDFVLVIGNPPYCGSDEAVKSGKADHLKVWQNEHANRLPNSGVREALLHYMGLAHTLLARGKRGMIAYVTSDTWLFNKEHEQVRRFFWRHYDPEYIVFLGPNMFPDVKVSTALVLLKFREAVRSENEVSRIPVKTYAFDSNLSPKKRFEELGLFTSGKSSIPWEDVYPDEFACIFPFSANEIYFHEDYIPLTSLFIEDFPACETGVDAILTDSNESELRSRMKKILASDSEIAENFIASSDSTMRVKMRKIRAIAQRNAVTYRHSVIKRYARFNGSKCTFSVHESRIDYVYYEPCLLHRSIMQGNWNPHEEDFRIGYNTYELPQKCVVIAKGEYLHRWQHMRFAPLTKSGSEGVPKSNLSSDGISLLNILGKEELFLHFISGWVNSTYIQSGFKLRATAHEVRIPSSKVLQGDAISWAIQIGKISKCLAFLERTQGSEEFILKLKSEDKEKEAIGKLITEILEEFGKSKEVKKLNSELECVTLLKQLLDDAVTNIVTTTGVAIAS